MCRLILIVIILLCVGVGISAYYLPWWGTVALVIGLILVIPPLLKWLVPFLIKRFFIGLFESKSIVLRGATAEVHSVEPTAAPAEPRIAIEGVEADGNQVLDTPAKPEESEGGEGEDEDEDAPKDKGPRDHYYVEATITPKASTGKFTHWDLDDLRLVPYEMKVTKDADSDDGSIEIREVKIEHEGGFVEPEGSKFAGARKLRMLIAAKPEVRRAKFRYYFEAFGDMRLK